ncbi:MAG: RelA/SpoT family protein [Bacteroidota bacterium]
MGKALEIKGLDDLNIEFELFVNDKELNYSDSEKVNIIKAFHYAIKAHGDALRKSGELYVWHPFYVAKIVAYEMGLSSNSIVAALLHETTKNPLVTIDEIKKEFGLKVAEIVSGITKIAGLYTQKISFNSENFIKLLLALATDVRIILIKLADRLHNMRTLDSLERERQVRIASETHDLYGPIAHRLGLYNVKTEFEEMSMKYMQPEIYNAINTKVEESKGAQNDYISRFVLPINESLKSEGLDFVIKGRTKSVYSIWKKMVAQKVEFEDVYDFFAIRIILNSDREKEKADCWHAYSVVSNIYKPNPKRLRDWISNSKKSGYESLHTTVLGLDARWVEVQIRTKRMDEIAEKGTAAHWKYKEKSTERSTDQWLAEIRELLEKPSEDEFDRISSSKVELYHNDVFVFTPKGDLFKMPKGSTVLDFAYRIHTNIGSKCTGAKIKNKVVPIKYVLQNGDQLDILTAKTQSPSQDWMSIAFSTQTRAKIRHALNEAKLKESLEGKEILQRKIKNWKLNVSEEQINRLVLHFKLKTMVDFYYLIAKEKIDLNKVKLFLTSLLTDDNIVKEQTQVASIPKIEKPSKAEMIIDGSSDKIDFELSKCCKPIFGDPIFGFVTVSSGVKIHHANCPNALQMKEKYPYRIVDAKWNKDSKKGFYKSNIKISGFDEFGMLNRLSEVISKDFKLNIAGMNISSKDNMFEGLFTVYVDNNNQLDSLIHKLMRVKGVNKVQRTIEEI